MGRDGEGDRADDDVAEEGREEKAGQKGANDDDRVNHGDPAGGP